MSSLVQEYLYGKTTKSLSYNDFVNKELVLFSNSDNERSLPCLVDGELAENSMHFYTPKHRKLQIARVGVPTEKGILNAEGFRWQMGCETVSGFGYEMTFIF